MTNFEVIQTVSQVYEDGGILMIPLSILSIFGLAACLHQAFNYLVLFAVNTKKNCYEVPKRFCNHKNYYQSFLSKSLSAKSPSKWFLKETQSELYKLKEGLWLIELIIQLAPILGILGTIIGIMQSIQGVDLSQELGMKIVSKGFSKALITSIYGLSLACIFQFIYSVIQSKLQFIQNKFSLLYLDLLEWESSV